MAIQVRATQQSIAARVMSGLQANMNKMGKLQEQLSSGKLITRPSDSPTGTVSSMQLRGQIRAAEQYSRNADDGLGWLSTVETSLTSSLPQAAKVRDLVLQGMSSGVGSSPEAREAIAMEVENIRESLIGLANARYLDRPVFGGVTAGDVAYDSNGVFTGTYDSANPMTTVTRTVGEGASVRVDVAGPDAFGPHVAPPAAQDPAQLFKALESVITNLRSGNTAGLDTDLGNLDTAISRLQTSLSDVGARYNRVEQMRQTADDRALILAGQLSEVEDIDLPKTIMDVKLQESSYEASLSAASRVIQPSLMDYLR